MSIQLTKIGNSPNVPAKEFVCDSEADIANLSSNIVMGSTAFCINEKSAWMKSSDNSAGEYENGWIKL
jgi:hypothetical protein